MAPDDPGSNMKQAQIAGVATGFAWSIAVTLIALIAGGVFLDAKMGTTPWLTLTGVALGLICAAYQLWELTRLGDRRKPSGPIGRRLERRAMQQSALANDQATEREP